MPFFPQLASGALCQFPIKKRRLARTITNFLRDGSRIRLADDDAATTEWELTFEELTDVEASTLQDFFLSNEGRLGTFTFLDPTDNLLTWSEQLDEVVWEKSPLVTVTAIEERAGAFQIQNRGAAAANIVQTLDVPESYWYSLSLFARSGTVSLLRNATKAHYSVGSDWRRLVFSTASESASETVLFGLELQPGASIDVFGLQVEAQPGPSTYKKTTSRCGIYPNARFNDDALEIVTIGPGRHSCAIKVIHGKRF
jgi:hypothetical protein